MNCWVEIIRTPLPLGTALASVQDREAGGIAVFLGTTRAERHASGRELVSLDYEAYQEMALGQMKELAERACGRWPILKLALLHRVGRVGLTEASVLVAVATPHRTHAFEACRFLIDELKKDVAIWKKQIWDDGSGTWVQGETPKP